MLRRSKELESIVIKLSLLHYYVRARSKSGHTDVNHDCESIFCELFNLTYGYQLVNLNKKKKNHPAVDLGDRENGISVQITASNEKSKIQETREKFENKKLYDIYDQLIVFIIGEKKSYKKDKSVLSVYSLEIKDIYDLIDDIAHLEPKKLSMVAAYVDKEISDELLNNISGDKQFSVKMYNATLFKNAKAFMRHMGIYPDFKPSDAEYQSFLDDIRSFIKVLEKLPEETRKLLFALIQICKVDGESLHVLPADIKKRLRYSRQALDENIQILHREGVLREDSYYYDGIEYESYSIFYKAKNDWQLISGLIDFLPNEDDRRELLIDLDFSLLDD